MHETAKDEHGLTEGEFLAQYDPSRYGQLSVSVDTVVFGVDCRLSTENFRKLDEQKLTVLLIKRDTHPFLGCWSLPGGFVGPSEPLDDTARRVLRSKTGLDEVYLEQIYTFGAPKRDPRMRIISCAYLALIDRSKHTLSDVENGLQNAWFEIEFGSGAEAVILKSGEDSFEIPIITRTVRNGRIETPSHKVVNGSALAFDHATIILEALLRLRGKIEYTDIVFNLMPDHFTISDLQQIYEIILGRALITPQFRREIAPKLKGTDKYVRNKGHRPSQLFGYIG